ncbi:MAG: acylphosphatase [Planctomycetota bacterium]|nr:acylphosphatase [Planctomycetota bacterium]
MGEIPGVRAARRWLIDGRVQGVGFRWHMRLEARALGLVGWVRNLDDGRVEAHAEGGARALEELEGWLGRGPSGAVVEDVQRFDAVPEGVRSFEIR